MMSRVEHRRSHQGSTHHTLTIRTRTHVMQNAEAVPPRTDHDLMLADHALAVVLPVATRLGIPHARLVKRFHDVLADIVALDASDANEAELTAYGLTVLELARTLKTRSTTCDRTLARMQLDADLADDHLRGVLAIDGENPSTLDAYAAALEKSAAVNVTKARVARRRARQIRTGRTLARQQIGVSA